MKMPTKSLFIFAGEQSGDLHGSHLIKALKAKQPDLKIAGVAGPKMRSKEMECILPMEAFEVMGFSDVVCALPRLYLQFYKIRDHILSKQPCGVILIDYPGFNLRLAKALRQKGYKGKIIHYVAPTVWAWGKHRINMMADTLDLLLTIYPFESAYFEKKLNTTYVGNPLCEYLSTYQYDDLWQQKLAIPTNFPLIALFPGSRIHEITRNLPIMLQAASLYKKNHPEAIFCISGSHPTLLASAPKNLQGALFSVPKKFNYELMRDSQMAIAKSGTVTLELALHERPTVVIYKLTLLNRLYAKYVLKLKLPHYCIVNILAKRTTFPELIEKGLSAQNIFQYLDTLNTDKDAFNNCLNACREIQKTLCKMNSSTTAAESILRVMS